MNKTYPKISDNPIEVQVHVDNDGNVKSGSGEELTLNRGNIIYVTIGLPFSSIPIMQKVMIFVDPSTDTPVTAAKKLRKMVADNIENHGFVRGTKFTPAALYYEIYGQVDNNVPFAMSFNSRYRKEHIDG